MGFLKSMRRLPFFGAGPEEPGVPPQAVVAPGASAMPDAALTAPPPVSWESATAAIWAAQSEQAKGPMMGPVPNAPVGGQGMPLRSVPEGGQTMSGENLSNQLGMPPNQEPDPVLPMEPEPGAEPVSDVDDLLSIFTDADEENDEEIHRLAISLEQVDIQELVSECRAIAEELRSLSRQIHEASRFNEMVAPGSQAANGNGNGNGNRNGRQH